MVDTALGQLVRVDPKSDEKKMVAQLKPSLDNLAIDDKDRIFVSNMADNGIQEVVAEVSAKRIVSIDPKEGAIIEIAANLPIGLPAAPGGLPSNIPTGVAVGASGVIYFSLDIENAIYRVVRK